MYAHPEPSSANRTGYYVESTDVHPLPIGKLGHFTAHIHCLRTIDHCGLQGSNRNVPPGRLEVSGGFYHVRGGRPALPPAHVSAQANNLVRRIAVSERPNNYARLLRWVAEKR